MLLRLERYGLSEYELPHTRKEAQRLALALDDLAGGRPPLWLARTGTLLDPVIERLATLTGSTTNRSHEQKTNINVTSYFPPPHNQRRNQL